MPPSGGSRPTSGVCVARASGKHDAGAVSILWRPSRLQRKAQDLQGRFTKAWPDAKKAHAAMALKVAEMARDELTARIERKGRPQRGTQHLENAIMSPNNRGATLGKMWFFSESFMNSSQARLYWRRLEHGGPMVLKIPFSTAGQPSRNGYDLHLVQLHKEDFPYLDIEIPAYAYVHKAQQAFLSQNLPKYYYGQVFGHLPGWRWIH